MYLLLAVVVWMEARELAHATTRRISPIAPARGKRIASQLVLAEGKGPPSVDLVPPETVIGRDASCHVTIPDASVSHRHARVYHSDGEWYVEDLGSTNGTFVNDRPLTRPVVLRPGDTVSIGRSVLEARA
jgi:pSer/pThr/pTyr-binding forkhead associated (FHA) protein